MIVIGITRWTDLARYARGEFMRLKSREFTEAAKALGASDRKIIVRHILPNSLAPVLVTATFGMANAIEAALAFWASARNRPRPAEPSWPARASGTAWWLTTFPVRDLQRGN